MSGTPPDRRTAARRLAAEVAAFAAFLRADEDAGVRFHVIEGASAADRVAPPPPSPGSPARGGGPPRARPALDRAGRIAALAAVAREAAGCTACKLHSGRTMVVPGEGDPDARILFVGEGPGEQEDRTGRPFVGRAGQLLRRLIREELGLDPARVFIANVVKCRPPENRPPEPDEAAACLPFLRRQVAILRPRILVTLGNPATQSLLQTREGISRLRGRPVRRGEFVFVPTFHPSYLLRNPPAEPTAREDFRLVRSLLDAP